MSNAKKRAFGSLGIIAIVVLWYLGAGINASDGVKGGGAKVEGERVKYSPEMLVAECNEIEVGMTLSDADEILRNRNHRTKTTFSDGGHIQYWISLFPTEIFPGGKVCKVSYDVNEVVLKIEIKDIPRSK